MAFGESDEKVRMTTQADLLSGSPGGRKFNPYRQHHFAPIVLPIRLEYETRRHDFSVPARCGQSMTPKLIFKCAKDVPPIR